MELYFIISACVLAVSAGITLATKTVSNWQFIASLLAFPLAYFAAGLPLDGITAHVMNAGIMLVLGFIAYITLKVGGGVVRAFIIAGLWIPGLEPLFNYVCFTLIFSALVILVVVQFKKSQTFEHYAGIVLACACAFSIYQYVEMPPARDASAAQYNAHDKTPDTEPPLLRGTPSIP